MPSRFTYFSTNSWRFAEKKREKENAEMLALRAFVSLAVASISPAQKVIDSKMADYQVCMYKRMTFY